MPLTTVRGTVIDARDVQNMPGFVGVASTLCHCDEQYAGIRDSLLGRTIVAEDLDRAAEIARIRADAQMLAQAANETLERHKATQQEVLQAMAELENTRRRSSEEVQKARKFGIEKFAENLLPVVDSLEKALEVTKNEEENPVREGMLATYRQFMHALDVSGMKPVDPKGEAFDPHQHQAIAMVPAPEGVASGTVVEVFQRGWVIADRVLRPAMVSVAQG